MSKSISSHQCHWREPSGRMRITMATSPSFTPAPSWKTWRAPVGIPTFTLEFPSSGPDDSDNAYNGTECWRTRQSFLNHCSSDRSFSLRAWLRGDLCQRIRSSAGTTDTNIPSTSVLLQKIVASLDHVIEHVVWQKILIVDQRQHFGCEDLEIISRNVLNDLQHLGKILIHRSRHCFAPQTEKEGDWSQASLPRLWSGASTIQSFRTGTVYFAFSI